MTKTKTEKGPLYGVALIDILPLGGGMQQQMPGADDLRQVMKFNQRVVAGYEVLLARYMNALKEIEELKTELSGCQNSSIYKTVRS